MNGIPETKTCYDDFVERSVKSNRIILRIGAAFGVLMEFVNIFRVLILTDHKLSTLNNLIYFSLYLVYFIACAAFLVIDFFGDLTVAARYKLYMVAAGVSLSWHLLFNIYDVHRAGAVGYFTVITSIFLLSGFLIFKPVFTIIGTATIYFVFVLYLKLFFSSGEVINFTITVILCLLMYLIRYKHTCIEVSYGKRIREVQQELTKAQNDFRLTIEQYELISKQENFVTFEWDIKEDWIRFSKEWRNYFDIPGSISGFHRFIIDMDRLTQRQKDMLCECMDNIRSGTEYQKYELILPTKTGEIKWFELRVITQKDENSTPVYGIGMLVDITASKEQIRQLKAEIRMDVFTGLLNKTSIEKYGERKITELRGGEKLASLILDMDDFKEINDRFGHPAGDYVLKQVAEIMRKDAPPGARIGRIGGDEFNVLLVTDDLKAFDSYAKKLVKKVSEIKWNGSEIPVSCSVGIAWVSDPKQSYAKLYEMTDAALYEAKRRGKNQMYSDLTARAVQLEY